MKYKWDSVRSHLKCKVKWHLQKDKTYGQAGSTKKSFLQFTTDKHTTMYTDLMLLEININVLSKNFYRQLLIFMGIVSWEISLKRIMSLYFIINVQFFYKNLSQISMTPLTFGF